MADMSITIQHLGGARYVGRNEAGDQIIIDGEDIALGVRPMEALLASLGICTAFDVVEILSKRRTPVQSYRIELEGERAEEHPRRYTRIRVRHFVGGEGITPESLQRAISLSHDKLLRSGVLERRDRVRGCPGVSLKTSRKPRR
jgi:putative redox protein